ncbi:MAG: hypothetical protein ABEJ87_01410 [Candidatus Nanohalobium sp.]
MNGAIVKWSRPLASGLLYSIGGYQLPFLVAGFSGIAGLAVSVFYIEETAEGISVRQLISGKF